jgi:signal transduction histidine kinase
LETVSPSALAREAVEIVTWPSRHRLVLALDGLPDSIECDPTLIRIALSNLLDNAVKYSDGGTVEFTGSASDGNIKFSVSDEGQGLKDGDTERLFERFARGTVKKASGAGLGLYVARRIARLHGGDVTARNKPGGGALFELEIRRQVSAANPR